MPSARGRSARGRPLPTDRAPLGAPVFVLNLKTFPTALGPRAVAISDELARAGRELGVAVAVAPAAPDLATVAGRVPIPVLAQHADPVDAGPTTGFVPVAAVAASGAKGSLLNHSEHPLAARQVAEVAARLAGAGLTAVVCARDSRVAGRLASVRPAYLAVEPPELIGGDRAVSTAKPGVIVAAVTSVHAVSPRTRVLCGAGIRGREDVRRSLELGAEGVLVASAVTLARRPRAAIDELLAGF